MSVKPASNVKPLLLIVVSKATVPAYPVGNTAMFPLPPDKTKLLTPKSRVVSVNCICSTRVPEANVCWVMVATVASVLSRSVIVPGAPSDPSLTSSYGSASVPLGIVVATLSMVSKISRPVAL